MLLGAGDFAGGGRLRGGDSGVFVDRSELERTADALGSAPLGCGAGFLTTPPEEDDCTGVVIAVECDTDCDINSEPVTENTSEWFSRVVDVSEASEKRSERAGGMGRLGVVGVR